MPYPEFAPIPRFMDYTPGTWVIPKMYWDAFSIEQRWHAMCKMISKLICYANDLGIRTDELSELYETLVNDFEAFKEHGFEDYYQKQLEQWVNDNLGLIYDTLVKQVYFGLTLDDGNGNGGRFVAYIPESWDDIVFDTGMIYGVDTYGRLILRWDVDNSDERVNQRPEDWS